MSGILGMMFATSASSVAPGNQIFTNPNDNGINHNATFVVPPGVNSISVVCVGGGSGALLFGSTSTRGSASGAGGGLVWANLISVTPGQTLAITVGAGSPGVTSGNSPQPGGDTVISRGGQEMIRAYGGGSASSEGAFGGTGLITVAHGSGRINQGGRGKSQSSSGGVGGGGAAGYMGSGGGGAGSGGGGGGGGPVNDSLAWGGGGGGVGITGQGSNGAAGAVNDAAGKGGSGGTNGATGIFEGFGGLYGGGGGGRGYQAFQDANRRRGGNGAVNIIWPGTRSFPNPYSTIATPTPTPAIGGALDGGFHAGLMFNEVTQSATATTISTGLKTFVLTDAGALFFIGQQIQVRSRANPMAARMIGAVNNVSAQTVTVNVTSVNGSGTLDDWSMMCQFRLIVCAKAFETRLQYRNHATYGIAPGPAATRTLTEGRKATLALCADGNAAVYPAAHYCNNLTAGGYTDWYLPARDELEVIYRNLKPETNWNNTANRYTGGPDYQNLGSLGDVANQHGINNNSSPPGSAYQGNNPTHSSNTAFRLEGAQSLQGTWPTEPFVTYRSSTEIDDATVWTQIFVSTGGNPGWQLQSNKENNVFVRPIRRSIM